MSDHLESEEFIQKMKQLKLESYERRGLNKESPYVYFTVVGMRFHGNHRFTKEDAITLEKEDDNPKDPKAIRVMIDGKKVAYVAREDAIKLRDVEEMELCQIEMVSNKQASTDMKLIKRILISPKTKEITKVIPVKTKKIDLSKLH